jgi:protein SERAC1
MTRGLVFLGTPHQGSAIATWFEGLAKITGLLKQTNDRILGDLKRESDELVRIQDSFHNMITSRDADGLPPIEVICCYEELPMPGIVGMVSEFGLSHFPPMPNYLPYFQVVTQQSAILPGSLVPIGIHRNHREMAKFDDERDPGFKAITAVLRRWIKRSRNLQGKSINLNEQNSIQLLI